MRLRLVARSRRDTRPRLPSGGAGRLRRRLPLRELPSLQATGPSPGISKRTGSLITLAFLQI
nr:MAG TPA: hypothetical protein [Caudoviricetes sp.]